MFILWDILHLFDYPNSFVQLLPLKNRVINIQWENSFIISCFTLVMTYKYI